MKDTVNHELKDVIGIGNAIVDVLVHEDDKFLKEHGIVKGAMTLTDEDHATSLYKAMGTTTERSGGSVGNTIAGIVSLGGSGSYIGKVNDDKLGNVFRSDLQTLGVNFDTLPANTGPSTARSLIIITPDGQRSMVTYLGASVGLRLEDVNEERIRNHKIIFLEGYLWDSPQAKEASVKAAKIACEAGRKVALTLSDPFCVDRHRESFMDLLNNYVDIFFANESEVNSLYQVEDFDTAITIVRRSGNLAALTRSEKGSIIVSNEETHIINAVPVKKVVDATGAGDLYAAGVLYGLSNAYDLKMSGSIGSIVAAEIISHVGARPISNLKELTGNLKNQNV